MHANLTGIGKNEDMLQRSHNCYESDMRWSNVNRLNVHLFNTIPDHKHIIDATQEWLLFYCSSLTGKTSRMDFIDMRHKMT